MSKQIQLTRGKFAIVDDDDYDRLSPRKWQAHLIGGTWYAGSDLPRPSHKRIYMHREVTRASPGLDVDHIDGDGLNNQKSNLRTVPHFVNLHNSKKHIDNKSGFKGVVKQFNKFGFSVHVYGKSHKQGMFNTAQEASEARIKFINDNFLELVSPNKERR